MFERQYGISLPDDFEGIDERIVPFAKAPVIFREVDAPLLKKMQFSLIPSWSKEKKPKFATYNARIEDIETKPTWKEPFKKFHCIVPISNFIEPIYIGKYAGNMVSFHSTELLNAAGIYNTWVDKTTGEIIDSFAIVMQNALPFVEQTGHERSPIFLSNAAAKTWLTSENEDPIKLKNFLNEYHIVPELKADIDRPMAKGWERRIPKTDAMGGSRC